MKPTFFKAFLVLTLASVAHAHEPHVSSSVLQADEELVYKVKWQFFHLGTVTVRTERDTSDSQAYTIIMILESNPELPFVRIREYNESLVSAADMMSQRYLGLHHKEGRLLEIRYKYEKARRRAFYTKKDVASGTFQLSDTLENIPPYVDGPALFFYGRWQSASNRVLRVPTIVNDRIEYTELDFTVGREDLKIDALRAPIRTRKYKGLAGAGAKAATSAGVSGEFTGWISDDEAAIPVRIEMKVFLGSICMELQKWSRRDWNLPSASKL